MAIGSVTRAGQDTPPGRRGALRELLLMASSEQTRFRSLAKRLAPNKGKPRYYPEPRGGKYGRVLADARTPAVVARWGFRMNTTQRDLRGFLRKHLG